MIMNTYEMEKYIYQQLLKGKCRREVVNKINGANAKIKQKLVYFENPCRELIINYDYYEILKKIIQSKKTESGFCVFHSRFGLVISPSNIGIGFVEQPIYFFRNGEVLCVKYFFAGKLYTYIEGRGSAIVSEKVKKILYNAGISASEIKAYKYFSEDNEKSKEYIRSNNFSDNVLWIDSSLFTIGVCSESIRGKSTLINALLGERIAPDDVLSCRCPPICFKYGDKRTIVYYKNSQSEDICTSKLVDFILYENDSKMSEVDGIVVYNPNPILKDVQLIELPSLNQSEEDNMRTKQMASALDTLFMVLVPDSPFAKSEAIFLSDMMEFKCFEHLCIILNKIDTVREKDKNKVVESVCKKIHCSLNEYANVFFADSTKYQKLRKIIDKIQVIPMSAQMALDGKIDGDEELVSNSGIYMLEKIFFELKL